MAVESPPWAIQYAGLTYPAEQTRRAMYALLNRTSANTPGVIAGGVMSNADCALTAPASGLSVNVAVGEMIIPGTEGGSQGGYYARVSSQTTLPIATANASNPRVDSIYATVSDSNYTEPSGGSGNQWALQVIPGTPTSGATLTNLLGVAAAPASSLLIGYVLVPAAAASIVTADIQFAARQAQTSRRWNLRYPAGGTITAAQPGDWVEPLAVATVTLPSGVPTGSEIMVRSINGTVTVNTSSGSIVTLPNEATSASYQLITLGAFMYLVYDGQNWICMGGSPGTGTGMDRGTGAFAGNNAIPVTVTVGHNLGVSPGSYMATPDGWQGYVYANGGPTASTVSFTAVPASSLGTGTVYFLWAVFL